MPSLRHFVVAFLITVAVQTGFAWIVTTASGVLHRNYVRIYAGEHKAEVQQAISALHLPDVRIEQGSERLGSYMLPILLAFSMFQGVAVTLGIFFGVLWLLRRGSSTSPEI